MPRKGLLDVELLVEEVGEQVDIDLCRAKERHDLDVVELLLQQVIEAHLHRVHLDSEELALKLKDTNLI